MSNTKHKIFGWALLSLLVMAAIICLDQLLLFFIGGSQNHFLYCRINAEFCSHQIFKPHPKHGFLFDPDKLALYPTMTSSPEVGRHTDYSLNENGFRLPPKADGRKKIKVNIFGDSFAFGAFLREREQLASRLNAASSKCEFRNYAVPGFNFLQMIGLSRDPELVAESDLDLFLFISDDIFGRLTTRPVAASLFGRAFTPLELSRELGMDPGFFVIAPPQFLVENSFLFQQLGQIMNKKFWISVNREVLAGRLFRKLASGAKQKLYFHIPDPGDYSRYPDGTWRLHQPPSIAAASLGERVIAGDRSFGEFEALFFREDGHPNPAGAEWVASKVMGKLKDICQPGGSR